MTITNTSQSANSLPPATWRLILSKPAPGAWNMAVDEAIMEAAGEGHVPPTLRLFAWDPACLTIGYAQEISDANLDALQAHGWDLVRRITGGRAILHTDELTYSVTGPITEPRLVGDILTSYQRLSTAILAALQELGLDVQSLPKEDSPPGPSAPPVCFEMPSNFEITVNGKKLVGSAQARKKNGVLQHGALPLYGDLTRIIQALTFKNEEHRSRATSRLLERASNVEGAIGRSIKWETAANAFIKGFSETLNLTFETGELTAEELARAKELKEVKYNNPEWTNSR